MNIINIEHISKTFGEKVIFEDASCGVSNNDKIGIVGINGVGKTTLLKMIAGRSGPDEGQIVCQNGLTIAYLAQNPQFPQTGTVGDYAFKDAKDNRWQVESCLTQLGITDFSMPLAQMSGGQRRKAAMAKVLAGTFDVLLLDEPTNHLDEAMTAWLEDYLKSYKGAVLMVTHDRYFLDKVSNKIWEVSGGNIYSYDANYSKFLELKVQREEMALATERKRQSLLRMELEWAKRGCRARSTKQKARLERLEKLKSGGSTAQTQNVVIDAAVGRRMGKKTIELNHVSKSYGDKKLIDDFTYIVLKNQRLGIIGPNGCGKSTLLKIMAGLAAPDSGTVDIGETIKIGYLAQEEPDMDSQIRVIDYIRNIAEYVQTGEGRISASKMLERFLFTPDMQYAPVNKLSGGEKRRLYLLSVLVGGANVLMLDEPSNNVDIATLTVLEDYLNDFSGIVVAVSHDRYFLDNVADRIFEFDGDGKLVQYEGGYTDYLEAKQRRQKSETDAAAQKKASVKSKSAQRERNRPVKLKFTYAEQKEFETIDEDIETLEQQVDALEKAMEANATNSAKLFELMTQKETARKALDEKMDRWVYLNELYQKIQQQKNL